MLNLKSDPLCCQNPEINRSMQNLDSNGNMFTSWSLSHFRHSKLSIMEFCIIVFLYLFVLFYRKSQYNFIAFIYCLLILLYKLSDIRK